MKRDKTPTPLSFSAPNFDNSGNFKELEKKRGQKTGTVSTSKEYSTTGVCGTNCCIMIDFFPPRLVRGKTRWYIEFYQRDPVDGIRKRHRETFDLNRIHNIRERQKAARSIILEITRRLPEGYPYDPSLYHRAVSVSAKEALRQGLEAKKNLRHESYMSYKSKHDKFLRYLESRNLADIPVAVIDSNLVMDYSDHINRQGISARGHNNDISDLHALFTEIKKRKLIQANPFFDAPKRKVSEKYRQPIDPVDMIIILDEAKHSDKSLYLSCLLLFYCMIRPKEQRYLKVDMFNFQKAILTIPGDIAKNHKTQTVTIPDQLREILFELRVDTLSKDQYILAPHGELGANTPVGKSLMSNHYRDLIRRLHKEGMISSIIGNTLYSWKDTGMDFLAAVLPDAVKLRNQARHHSLQETQIYLSRRPIADLSIRVKHRLPELKEDSTIARTKRTGA